MAKVCVECGKEIKEESDSEYCKRCDEKLDKQFESIEDNITIYKELRDFEIEILNKFEKEDIIDLYTRIYEKFNEKEDFTEEEVNVLNNLRNSFSLSEDEIGRDRVVAFKESSHKKTKDKCPDCGKDIKEDFNLCPYCGYNLKN